MKKLKDNIVVQLFVIYLRYLIGGAFVFASVVKIMGGRFTTLSGTDEPINSAWHMFETLYASGLWWKFLGLGQLIAGFLLMTQRYAKLGALMFFPIAANVFVITISYDFRGTPYITGLLVLANIFLILWNWDELKILVNKTPVMDRKNRFENDRVWEYTGLAIFLFTAGYRYIISGYSIMFWGAGCAVLCLAGLVIGLTRLKNYR
jgi:hypothetical protein